MSNKSHLTLYVDNEVKNLAKSSNFNLSQEFEDWLRVRLNMKNKEVLENNIEDADKLIAEYRMKIEKLQSAKELDKELEMQKSEQKQVIYFQIDNMIENNEPLQEPFEPLRIKGIQFIFKKKFNIIMNTLEARETLLNGIEQYLKEKEEMEKQKDNEKIIEE